jgi:hypothetical protein
MHPLWIQHARKIANIKFVIHSAVEQITILPSIIHRLTSTLMDKSYFNVSNAMIQVLKCHHKPNSVYLTPHFLLFQLALLIAPLGVEQNRASQNRPMSDAFCTCVLIAVWL